MDASEIRGTGMCECFTCHTSIGYMMSTVTGTQVEDDSHEATVLRSGSVA